MPRSTDRNSQVGSNDNLKTMLIEINGKPVEIGLREAWNHLTPAQWRCEARNAQIEHFRSTRAYCGSCGSRMEDGAGISRKCPVCGREEYPAMSPAILVLVKRKDKALLVRSRNFSRPMFGLVAGFVETGETLEECVAREVREETTLEIENIRYFASQSWPFPSQLMVAFTAEYVSGEIEFADGELADGGWFACDSLPALPSMPSLARVLIDHWRKEKETNQPQEC